MPDIVINPSLGKIDFFTVKGEQVTNSMRLIDASTILFTGPLSASAISTGGGGAFVTSVQPTSNYLTKFTSNSTIANSLVYDNGTNVGIGTTSPIFKFQVVGSAYVNNGTLYIDSGNSLTWGNSTQSILGTNDVGLSFTAGSANRMFISSSGNIGIGTTTTAARLHVNSTTSGATLLRTDGTNGTLFSVVDDLSDSLMSVNNSAGLPVLEVFADDRIVGGQYGQNDFVVVNNKVGIGTNNPTAKLQVTSSTSIPSAAFLGGNVGVGTSSPTQLLELKKTTGSAIALLNYNDSVKFNINASSAGVGYVGMVSNHDLLFVTNDTERARVTSTGCVGIGTTSVRSNSLLTVYGSGAFGTSAYGFYVGTDATGAFLDAGTQLIRMFAGQQERIRIDANGNLGIGTTSPAGLLDVRAATVGGKIIFGTYDANYQIRIESGDQLNFYNGASANPGYINYAGGATVLSQNLHVEKATGGTNGLVRIKSDGNVGIGTTSPAYKLDVLGDVKIGNSSGAGNLWIIGARDWRWIAGTTGYGVGSGFGLFDNTANAYRISVDTNGNVGIGTTSPTYTLHVEGTGTQRINVVSTNNSSTGAGIYFQVKNSGTLVSNSTLTIDNSGNLKIFTGTSSESEKMRIDNNGNVGIGTTSPGYKLQAYNSSNGTTAAFGGTAYGVRIDNGGTYSSGRSTIFGVDNTFYGSYQPLCIGASTLAFSISGTDKVTIDTAGNVGIGTTSPSSKLHIDDATAPYITISRSGVPTWQLRNNFPSNQYGFSFNNTTAGTVPLFIGAGGNIGIGLDSPAAKLDIVGTNTTIALSFGTTVPNNPLFINTYGGYAGVGMDQTTAGLRLVGDYSGGTNPLVDIGYYTSGTVAHANWINRLRVLNNGNVGIGTTSPITKLDVRNGYITAGTGVSTSGTTILGGYYSDGNLTILGTEYSSGGPMLGYGVTPSTTSAGAFLSSTGINVYRSAYVQDGGTHRWFTGTVQTVAIGSAVSTSEKMRINADGNVGIGTSSPLQTLHVNGSILLDGVTNGYQQSATRAIGYGSNSGATSTDGFSGMDIQSVSVGGNYSQNLRFWTHYYGTGTGATPRMVIQYNGSVGIGTTSPSNKTTIDADATGVSFADNGVAQLVIRGTTDTTKRLGLGVDTTNNIGVIQAQKYGTAAYPLALNPVGGNVGIGTTSPGYKLDVYGDLRISGSTSTIGTFKSSASSCFISLIDSSGDNVFLGNDDGDFLIQTPTSAYSTKLIVKDDGNVGIGTTSPTTKLAVSDGTTIAQVNPSSGVAYFGTVNNYPMALSVNSSEKVRILNDGNVGIGTTSPATILQVVGTGVGAVGTVNIKGASVHLGLTSAAGSFKGWYGYFNTTTHGSDNDLNIKTGYAGTSNIRFSADGDTTAAMLYIKSDGNVGIGTTSPASLLQVGGSSGATATPTAITFDNTFRNAVGGNTSLKIYLYKSGGETYGFGLNNAGGIEYHAGSSGGSSANHAFYTETTEKMRIISDGNVGIGTSSPTAKLHLTTVGGDGTPALRILASASDTFNWASSTMYANLAAAETAIHLIGKAQSQYNSAYLGYRHVSDTSASNMLSLGLYAADHLVNILGSGNVGIGTTSPGTLLQVHGSNPFVRINNTITGDHGIKISYNNSDTHGLHLLYNANSALSFIDNTYPTSSGQVYGDIYFRQNVAGTMTTRMTIKADGGGNVGIGTTAPGYKLDVNGPIGVGGFRFIDQSTHYFRIFEPAGNIALYLGNASDPANYYDNTTHYFRNRGGSSNYVIINSSGNLGIGTSTVGAPLTIYKASNPWMRINGGGAFSYIQLDDGTSYGYLLKNTSSDTSNNALAGALYTYTDSGKAFQHIHSGTPLFTILSGGSVGIGTTSPGGKLEVRTNAASTYIFSGTSTSGYTTSFTMDDTASYIGHDSAARALTLRTNSTARLTILGGGNVGIGTTSPAYRLQLGNLTSTSTATPEILSLGGTFSNSAGSNVKLRVYDDGIGNIVGMSVSSGQAEVNTWSTGKIAFYRGTTQSAIIDTNGNLGIGTTSPSWLLTVYAATTPQFTLQNGTRSFVLTNNSADNLLSFNYASVNRLQFDTTNQWFNTGNVGIGSTSPGSKLDVTGAIRGDAGVNYPHSFTNTDAGNTHWTNRGDRLLTSNGTNWAGDGKDPIMALVTSGNTNATTIANSIGLALHNESTTDNTFSPAIVFSNRSNSTSYNTAYAAIIGRKTGQGVDSNWSAGELHFYTMPAGAYVSNIPSMLIRSDGNVGIGTTSILAKLHVNSTIAGATLLRTDGTNGTLFSVVDDLSDSLMSVNNSAGLPVLEVFADDRIVGGQYGQNDFVVRNNRVGIGTNNPLAKLHVSGSNATSIIDGLRIGRGSGDIFSNTAVGSDALRVNTTGRRNTAVGYRSMYTNIGGEFNTAFGYNSMYYNTNGYNNTAVGYKALESNTEGANNTAFGYRTLLFNTVGTYNIAVGIETLINNTFGSYNTAIGHQALSSNNTGNKNCAFGRYSLRSNKTNNNSAFGYSSLKANTTGTANSAFGYLALASNIITSKNSAFGYKSLQNHVGAAAQQGPPIGEFNSAFGVFSLTNSTSGEKNCAFGYKSLYQNNSGINNSAFGYTSLQNNTTGFSNSAFGIRALWLNIGGYQNCAFGGQSLTHNTFGQYNNAFGVAALLFNEIGNNNNAVGYLALRTNTTSNNNAFGYKALYANTTGIRNSAFGHSALNNNTIGTANTAFGYSAGSAITTGTNLTVIGYNAAASSATATNEVTLGNSSVATLRCQVTTITSLSDFRDKTDINDIQIGLSFVEKLRPVTFKWDKREWYTDGNRDGSKKDSIIQAGFIAQELKQLQEEKGVEFLKLVYESNPDKLEATPGNLLIPLIKAVQELSIKVKFLENKIVELESK